MNREIIFRGKSDRGEWIEGYFCPCCFGRFPCDPAIIGKDEMDEGCWRPVRVDPATVGQYTGLTDKNGKKIFEGDIVKATFSHNNWMQDRVEKRTATYEVRYNEKYCYFYLAKHQNNMLFDGNWTYFLHEIEVIGNIHDNPELLEGEQT